MIERFPDFNAANDAIPWLSMRGMRSRIAQGYFKLDLNLVWDTAATKLPSLAEALAPFGDCGAAKK